MYIIEKCHDYEPGNVIGMFEDVELDAILNQLKARGAEIVLKCDVYQITHPNSIGYYAVYRATQLNRESFGTTKHPAGTWHTLGGYSLWKKE